MRVTVVVVLYLVEFVGSVVPPDRTRETDPA